MQMRTTSKLIFAIFFFFICISCNKSGSEWIRLGFDKCHKVSLKATDVSEKDLGSPEMISVNDSILVMLDVYDNYLFSSFDIKRGKLLKRFGKIGNGPGEILLDSIGNLRNDEYIVYDLQARSIMKYNPESQDSSYSKLKIEIPKNAYISRIAVPNDSTAIIMGTYNNRYKYAVLNHNGVVSDSLHIISGVDDPKLSASHKFLSEQGELTINSDNSKIATTTNYSDNISFINISHGTLRFIREINLRDPDFSPISMGQGVSQILPSTEEPIGFIRLTSNSNYVFALYSKHSLKEGGYFSQYILCYDWNGTPIIVLDTNEKIFAIASNDNTLFAVTMNDEGLYNLKQFDLREFSDFI